MAHDQAPLISIFANGIWKSGNHLLLKLCDMLGYPISGSGIAASLINGKFRLARKLIRGPSFGEYGIDVGLEQDAYISASWLDRSFQSITGRTMGGHASHSVQLSNILRRRRIKVLQLIRDPRDIVLSYAKWIVTRPNEYWYPTLALLPIETRISNLITGFSGNAGNFYSIAAVMDRSYEWLRQSDVLTVRFEDLVGENGQGSRLRQHVEINRIIDFLGLAADEWDFNGVSQRLFGGTATFRSGQIGNWRDEFQTVHLKEFESVVGPKRMHDWGYD